MRKVLVSVPATDLRIIDAAARKAGERRSAFLRRVALAEAHRVRTPIEDPAKRRAFSALLRRAEHRTPMTTAAQGQRSGPTLIEFAVDASVAFKWLIPDEAEDNVPRAKTLLVDHMEGRTKIIIPISFTTRSETLSSSDALGRRSKKPRMRYRTCFPFHWTSFHRR